MLGIIIFIYKNINEKTEETTNKNGYFCAFNAF